MNSVYFYYLLIDGITMQYMIYEYVMQNPHTLATQL